VNNFNISNLQKVEANRRQLTHKTKHSHKIISFDDCHPIYYYTTKQDVYLVLQRLTTKTTLSSRPWQHSPFRWKTKAKAWFITPPPSYLRCFRFVGTNTSSSTINTCCTTQQAGISQRVRRRRGTQSKAINAWKGCETLLRNPVHIHVEKMMEGTHTRPYACMHARIYSTPC
jgi:hypothetical protein